MSELSVYVSWAQNGGALVAGQYSNAHTVKFNDAFQITADAAPDWGGDARNTNPEQALTAALSSCHMMTFLALAAKAKWPVTSFSDHAVAHLGQNCKGKMSVVRIDLQPSVGFDEPFEVSDGELEEMHERAHRYCFIANTLDSSVEIIIKK